MLIVSFRNLDTDLIQRLFLLVFTQFRQRLIRFSGRLPSIGVELLVLTAVPLIDRPVSEANSETQNSSLETRTRTTLRYLIQRFGDNVLKRPDQTEHLPPLTRARQSTARPPQDIQHQLRFPGGGDGAGDRGMGDDELDE